MISLRSQNVSRLLLFCAAGLFFAGNFVSSAGIAHGCTLIRSPLSGFDDAEFVFVGKVVGYTEPVPVLNRTNTNRGEPNREDSYQVAQGYHVELVSSFALPKTGVKFDVFTYSISESCGSLGMTESMLRNRHAIGTEVAVVAKISRRLEANVKDGPMRLDVEPASGLFFAGNPSPSSVYVYTSIEDPQFNLLRFEIRKDLLRLKQAENYAAKRKILERLISLEGGWQMIDYYFLIKNNTQNKQEADELFLRMLKVNRLDEKRIKGHLKCIEEKVKSGALISGKRQQC